jgi:putative transcriptional regulator
MSTGSSQSCLRLHHKAHAGHLLKRDTTMTASTKTEKHTKHFAAMLESVKEMRAIEKGDLKPGRQYTAVEMLGADRVAVIEARRNTGLSQAKFAAVLDVSPRTLQDWEQGRRQPTGAARTLIRVAARYPKEVLLVTRGATKQEKTLTVIRQDRPKRVLSIAGSTLQTRTKKRGRAG